MIFIIALKYLFCQNVMFTQRLDDKWLWAGRMQEAPG